MRLRGFLLFGSFSAEKKQFLSDCDVYSTAHATIVSVVAEISVRSTCFYLFILHIIVFIGLKYPNNILVNFENKNTTCNRTESSPMLTVLCQDLKTSGRSSNL